MKIRRIDIDNFGALSDFHLALDNNLTVINKDNGWGKSTLASFIRVMFYGFADESKKIVADRERNRLRPWNHGIYGGAIEYEYQGKQYRLQRTFGAKSSDDTCSLVDITTKLPCKEFDTDNLGIQLMGIDSEAYIRTLFIGQNKLSVRNDKGSLEDSITAKIGNLTEATDDINNFDAVMERLKKECNGLKSGHKKGIINELKSERDILVAGQNTYKLVIKDIDTATANLKELGEELKACDVASKRVDAEYSAVGKAQQQKSMLEKADELRRDIEKCKASLATIRETFKLRIPSVEEVNSMIGVINDANILKEKCKSMGMISSKSAVSEEQGDRPQADEIEIVQATISRRNEIRAQIGENKAKYNRNDELLRYRRDAAIAEWNRDKERAREHYQEKLGRISSQEKLCIGFTVAGVLALISVIIVLALVLKKPLIAIAAGAVLLVGIIVIFSMRGIYKKRKSQIDMEKVDSEPDFSREEREQAILQDDIAGYSKKEQECSRQIELFCNKYNIADDSMLEMKLFSMNEQLNKPKEDSKLADILDADSKRLSEVTETVNGWFRGIAGEEPEQWIETAISYMQMAEEYADTSLRLKEMKDRLDGLSCEEQEIGEVRDLAEIIREREELSSRIDEIKSEIGRTQEEHRQLLKQKNTLEEEKQKLNSIDEKLEEYHHKYDIINKTMSFLGKAKEKLSARYMDPIEDAFIKYYSYITTDYIDSYEIDADIKLTRQEMGQRRDSESMSKGYKDLMDVSLRMALLDVMYDGEKPWVIMDDPFVNLDTTKLEQVRYFLEELAKDYQVIYFTCHQSRA